MIVSSHLSRTICTIHSCICMNAYVLFITRYLFVYKEGLYLKKICIESSPLLSLFHNIIQYLLGWFPHSKAMQISSNPHMVLLASPGMGHLIPVFELGNRLATHHGITITIFVVSTDSSISESPLLRKSPAATLKIVVIPPVDISSLVGPNASVVTHIAVMMREAVPALRAAISAMVAPPTALVVDLFGTEAFVLAREFSLLKYVFITSNAWFLAVAEHLPSLSVKERHEHGIMKMPLEIPGCHAVLFEDTMDIFLDQPDPDLYPEFARLGIEITMADGVLVNTWQELEPSNINELRYNKSLGRVKKAPVYPIGPLVRPIQPSLGNDVIAWLNKQPKESVIYISFGSGGTLSAKQTIELAWGLELSRQRFIWVVRPPVDNDVSAAFFSSKTRKVNDDGTPDYLPEGFFTRTQGIGLVVPNWAPQTEILAHGSIGAFLSHCGWNSTLESMVCGVPMITWPLYAEQKMNATMLVEEFEVAVRLGPLEAAVIIGKEKIRDVLIVAMDDTGKGGKMKAKAKEMKMKGNEVLAKGGSSYNSLTQMAKECEHRMHRLSNKAFGA